jgi:ABC-2 type transport system ATP-binding protein
VGNILEVTGLSKSYKDFSITDVSFTLPEDCITGFIGINGAGKTTTIRAILGLAQKSCGTVKVFGKDMEKNEQEIKNRIGVVLDEGCFYDDLTMAEMKSVIAPAYTEWSDSAFKGYMDRFSLNPRQKISSLSKGMRMKYALSLALSHKADLLIMDEPTSGLDPLTRSQLLEIMTDYMKQGGKGVFFSTHITSDLDKVADMIVLMHDGRIRFEKERDFLFDNYRLVKGDTKALNDENRKLFLTIHTTDYGFSGLTDKLSEVQRNISDIVAERPTIEDIMLAHIEGVQK